MAFGCTAGGTRNPQIGSSALVRMAFPIHGTRMKCARTNTALRSDTLMTKCPRGSAFNFWRLTVRNSSSVRNVRDVPQCFIWSWKGTVLRLSVTLPLMLALNPVCLPRSEEHTSELQSRQYLVCRLL